MDSIKVRLATGSDCKDVFEWRNDQLTRQMSHATEIVEWVRHKRWFQKSLMNHSRLLLICEDDVNEKIAVIRFDLDSDSATISINLSPNQRDKGFAKKCLSHSIEYISSHKKKLKYLLAEIKEINLASQKLFLGVGFALYDVKDGVGYYRKNIG